MFSVMGWMEYRMIDQALAFLKNELNLRLKGSAGVPPESAETEREAVVFVDGESTDPITFPSGAVTALLINIEQEKVMRAAEPHRRTLADGTPQRINPEVRIDLSVLFVARYKQYVQALKVLSEVIQFFQEHPVFARSEYGQLPERIEKLLIEPVTLPLAAQNEVWTALRTAYQPSVLYRIKTLVFEDAQPVAAPAIDRTEVSLLRKKGGPDR